MAPGDLFLKISKAEILKNYESWKGGVKRERLISEETLVRNTALYLT